MQPLPFQTNDTDEYVKSAGWIDCYYNGQRIVMVRTGVTPPNHPLRAVYAEHVGPHVFDTKPPFYVLEDRRFWEATEWRTYWREHNCTPAQKEKQL